MSRSRRDLGAWGEKVASEYLLAQGYQILERNVHTPEGELDIVAKQGEWLVFVEVKARGSETFGSPEEAITNSKQRRLRKAAWAFLQEQGQLDADWRIDVVAIDGSLTQGVRRLEHYEFAVGSEDDS